MSGTEVSFVSRYHAAMLAVRQSGCASHDGGLDNNSEPSIKDLARNLAAESSSNAADIVDKFLSSTRLPSFDVITSGSRGKLPIDSCHLAALVTFDLAVCSGAMPEVSRELLQIAQGKLNLAGTKHSSQTCTNLKLFIEDMIKLLLEMSAAGQSASVSDLLYCDSLTSLLASSMLPLEADVYRVVVDGLVWIEKALTQTRDVLLQHSLHQAADCQCSCTPNELLPQLVDVCHNALPQGGLLPILQRFVLMLSYFLYACTEQIFHFWFIFFKKTCLGSDFQKVQFWFDFFCSLKTVQF